MYDSKTGFPIRLTCLYDGLSQYDDVLPDGRINTVEVEDYELFAIPITPEILEKNGFVYNEIPFVQGWEQYGLTLTVGGDGFRVSCGQNVSIIIDFVHQLQHALRLCGIEKEIVL